MTMVLRRRTVGFLLAMLAMLPAGATLAAADASHELSLGLRAGFGIDPDQFVVGVQGTYGKAIGPLEFAPSLDFGFGDDLTTYVLNGDLRLPIPLPRSRVGFYVGAGPAVAVYDSKAGGSDTEFGLVLLGGVMLPLGRTNSYSIEFRSGLGDLPEARFLLGIAFGGGRP